MEVDAKKLIDQVKLKRKQQKLSLRDLSKMVGVSFSALAKLEKGIGLPSKPTESRLLLWLNYDRKSRPHSSSKKAWFIDIEERLELLENKLSNN